MRRTLSIFIFTLAVALAMAACGPKDFKPLSGASDSLPAPDAAHMAVDYTKAADSNQPFTSANLSSLDLRSFAAAKDAYIATVMNAQGGAQLLDTMSREDRNLTMSESDLKAKRVDADKNLTTALQRKEYLVQEIERLAAEQGMVEARLPELAQQYADFNSAWYQASRSLVAHRARREETAMQVDAQGDILRAIGKQAKVLAQREPDPTAAQAELAKIMSDYKLTNLTPSPTPAPTSVPTQLVVPAAATPVPDTAAADSTPIPLPAADSVASNARWEGSALVFEPEQFDKKNGNQVWLKGIDKIDGAYPGAKIASVVHLPSARKIIVTFVKEVEINDKASPYRAKSK